MTDNGLPHSLLELAARNLLVDRLTAEVTALFSGIDIDAMLVKGPVIGEWLYHETVRGYGDSDVLVAASNWDRAVAALLARGFRDHVAPMAHPRMQSSASIAFVRGSQNLDLHCTLPGLDAAPEVVWEALWRHGAQLEVGGRTVAVPARPAVLMHLALHTAAHHADPKPVEDLRRGIVTGTRAEWERAAELAERLAGLPAFASGLRRVPEGAQLARMLDLERAGSVHFDLRAAGVPTAEGLHELFAAGLTLRQRGRLVLDEIFPRPTFMRWWSPVARRGAVGLLLSYPVRWGWLAVKVPAGLAELRRARLRRAQR